MRLRLSRARGVALGVLFVFATAFAPLLGSDQRNYLVILVSVAVLPLIVTFRYRFRGDVAWFALGLGFPLVTMLLQGGEDLSSFGYTAMLGLAYLAVAGALRTGQVPREAILKLLERLIWLFAAVSVLQMAASLAGLPIPNLILSKGLWSYNSLAAEPSHAGRALAMSMLCYLLLARQGTRTGVLDLLGRHRRLVAAFLLSVALTGSALAVVAAPLCILLALGLRWMLAAGAVLLLAGPALYAVDYEPLQRFLSFITALPSMDLVTLMKADGSGAVRIVPLLIYMERVSLGDAGFWFGEGGPGAIEAYFDIWVMGIGDLVGAGFVPGFAIAFGAIGAALFLAAFLLRFASRAALPLVVLWVVLFAFSPWNSQLFWYGLMLVRVAHHYLHVAAPEARRPHPAAPAAPQPRLVEQPT